MAEITQVPSTYRFVVDAVNSVPIGSIISRQEVRNNHEKLYGRGNKVERITMYIQLFVNAGYLTKNKVPTFYTVEKHFTEDLFNARKFLAEYSETGPAGQKYQRKIDENQLCSDELYALEYDTVKLILKCKLTYIQGCIVKYVVQYKADILFVQKIKQMCQYATIYGHVGHIWTATIEQELYVFANENELDDFQIAVIRAAYANTWGALIGICDKYITDVNV